jgi:hypothetical protein
VGPPPISNSHLPHPPPRLQGDPGPAPQTWGPVPESGCRASLLRLSNRPPATCRCFTERPPPGPGGAPWSRSSSKVTSRWYSLSTNDSCSPSFLALSCICLSETMGTRTPWPLRAAGQRPGGRLCSSRRTSEGPRRRHDGSWRLLRPRSCCGRRSLLP